MSVLSAYVPVEKYLRDYLSGLEDMPEVVCEKLEKACGKVSLHMVDAGSASCKWYDTAVLVRQSFELSFRTSGNDCASRLKALRLLGGIGKALSAATVMPIGQDRSFINAYVSDYPVLSVRCVGGEEEYTARYQLVYLEMTGADE